MIEPPIRHGVVGCVGIGATHADCVEETADAELVAGCDVDPEHARSFAAEHDVDWYTDVGEMVAAADLDAVSVATPSGTHADVTIAAAEAGAHVLCEKPLDVYRHRVDEMIETCEREGVTLAGVFQRRTASGVMHAKEAVEAGELGELVMADVEVKWARDQAYYNSAGWRGTRAMDGGVLMNQAIHGVDLLQWLAGDVESVTAELRTLAFDVEVEDTAVVTVEFEHGGMGTLEATTATYPSNAVTVELSGRDGTVVLEDGRLVRGETRDGELSTTESGGGTHREVVADFVDALVEGREPLVPAAEARTAVDITLTAYASQALGRPVDVDELHELETTF